MKPAESYLTDEELIFRYYSSSDDAAFASLTRRYYSRLYGIFLRYRVLDGDVPDLIQETWFRVIRTSDSLEHRFDPSKAGFATFIYSIATHLAADHTRRPQNRREIRESDLHREDDENREDSYFDTVAGESPDPAEALEISEETAEADTRFQLCLEELSGPQRLILDFRCDGLKFDAIGTILGLPLQTVATRQRRLMVQLRRCLAAATSSGLI